LYKVEGAGNDFLLGIGDWAERLAGQPELVVRLCDRRRGVGGDGVLALWADGKRRVRLVYRNADGGEAGFCANGTRCAARAGVELLGCAPRLEVATGWGVIPAEVDGAEVALELPPPSSAPRPLAISPPAGLSDLHVFEVGVPHVVAAAESLEEIDMRMVAPILRRHPSLGPSGANVNLYEIGAGNEVAVRSWERGVEAETLSCGSGLVAVALQVMARRDLRRIVCLPRSGDRLTVEALGEPPGCGTRMVGPARIVAEIEPSEELVRNAG
ncbi:MAG: diaminopimelate epimerase, partial [Thermoanaerobaculales bacterium]